MIGLERNNGDVNEICGFENSGENFRNEMTLLWFERSVNIERNAWGQRQENKPSTRVAMTNK